MQEKIAEAGLRHIRGCVVKSVEEAIEYYDEMGFDPYLGCYTDDC